MLRLRPRDGACRSVRGIRQQIRADVEKAGASAGVIRATHYEGSGMVRDGKGYGFVYAKGDDGKWRLQ